MTTDEERRRQHRHRHKQRVLRGIDDALVADFDAAAADAGSDRSGITRQLWEWYAGGPAPNCPIAPSRRTNRYLHQG
ncbi:hypothetical protein D3C59_35345 [Streptomyces sp. SHP22-7]|nr:hypothetical protein D3C59_35345 [Streptomyces sp. SHP22-7]